MAINRDILDIEKLKRRAGELLKVRTPVRHSKYSESEMLKTVHELEVYNIELKMLQEELERADEQIEDLTKKFDDLSELHNNLILQMIREQKHFEE